MIYELSAITGFTYDEMRGTWRKRGRKGMKQRRNKAGGKVDLDLGNVVHMLHMLASMTGALFIVALLCFLFLPTEADGKVIYVLVLAINLICCVGSVIAARILDKKDRELEEKEHKAAVERATVVKGGKKSN